MLLIWAKHIKNEMKITNWSHKNTYLCALSVRHRFTYLTARFAAVSKRNVHWVALKHRLNTWTLAHFYYSRYRYILLCFYRCYRNCIAAVQNSNIRGLSLKVNALSCPTPNPTLNLPDSVNKCKTDIKTYLLMQPVPFHLPYMQIWTALSNRDYMNPSSSPLKYVSILQSATEQTYCVWKPIDTKLDMCVWYVNVQKHQFSNLPAF